eukprot:5535641-Alexandrium_andersonii.AAC.1
MGRPRARVRALVMARLRASRPHRSRRPLGGSGLGEGYRVLLGASARNPPKLNSGLLHRC